VKVGVTVGHGVAVTGKHGSHSLCPATMMLLVRQLACLMTSTVV
jgi:hypothetical protein